MEFCIVFEGTNIARGKAVWESPNPSPYSDWAVDGKLYQCIPIPPVESSFLAVDLGAMFAIVDVFVRILSEVHGMFGIFITIIS